MFNNVMEVFKLLDKSNCRRCNEKTCLAFASKVFLEQIKLSDCPNLDSDVKAKYTDVIKEPGPGETEYEQEIASMRKRLEYMDFEDAARRTNGQYIDDSLLIRIFGKPFYIDKKGRFKSDIHINPWITGPVLTYVLESKGLPVSGNWVPFRELDTRELNGLFVKRALEPLKKIADIHPDLFEDLAAIFNGKKMEELYHSDISMVLYPLPLVPILICYWKNEDSMGSDMHLFFDKTASDNVGGDMVFRLTAGFVRMFEKLTITHGWQAAAAQS
jgi:hypothetical protein